MDQSIKPLYDKQVPSEFRMSEVVVAEISITCGGCTIPQRVFIAEANNILKHSNLKLDLHAMGTNVEGSIDGVLVAIKHIRERCHALGAPKVEIHLNISSRNEPASMEDRKRKVIEHQI